MEHGGQLKSADESLVTHRAIVWRTVTRLLGSRDRDAEDCFQDAFVEFWKIAQRQQVEHERALLIQIATRRAIDVIRRRRTSRRRHARSIDESDASIGIEPILKLETDELASALVEALADLPELQSTVFCMTQLDGLDHNEVAMVLNRSSNHVAVLLRRARVRLQSKLARFADSRQISSARST